MVLRFRWILRRSSQQKNTKANPIEDEDLKDCYEKWKKREISKYSWIVPVEEIVKRDYDLTVRNPNRKEETVTKSPEELVASALEKEKQILDILEEIQDLLNERGEGV